MQIKKEVLLFCLLIVLSISLLIAVGQAPGTEPAKAKPVKCFNCCREKPGNNKMESPWNWITGGILHLSV